MYSRGMPKLRGISEIPDGSRVLMRIDMDVPMKDGVIIDEDRLKKSLPSIQCLLEKKCILIFLSHIGRPKGVDEQLSLHPVFNTLVSRIKEVTTEVIQDSFIDNIEDEHAIDEAIAKKNLICLENVRFYKGEEENDPTFLAPLVKKTAWYVNDALAVSHRKHRSIMIHKEMKTAYGMAFIAEVTKLMVVVEDPKHPLTIILGGAKKDKLDTLPDLAKIADHILLGGRLPHLLAADMNIQEKFCIASLRDDGLDLNEHDIRIFTSIISGSKTIIWAGAMGVYENPSCRTGTEKIAKAIVDSGAYTVVAGGDTEASISNLGEEKKIDVIASGGGMVLELLTRGSLPAWE